MISHEEILKRNQNPVVLPPIQISASKRAKVANQIIMPYSNSRIQRNGSR